MQMQVEVQSSQVQFNPPRPDQYLKRHILPFVVILVQAGGIKFKVAS